MELLPQSLAEVIAQLPTIGILVLLEGILSVDNALALAVIARGLPEQQQRRALTFGLVGAVVFRVLALMMAGFLMKWRWVKFVGGGYLVWLAIQHWRKKGADLHKGEGVAKAAASFWRVVLVIELTDIAFAADSILAAVAVSQKLWVVVVGGLIGLIMMRFAASVFIVLLKKFPAFENTAFLLVFGVGLKLLIQGFEIPGVDFHGGQSPAFWIFWGYVAVCLLLGFRRKTA